MISRSEGKAALEAVLMASFHPLRHGDLERVFEGALSSETIVELLRELAEDCDVRGVELAETASGWRFRIKPRYHSWFERLLPEKPSRYSRAVMETLAIIAYRQPVSRGDIEAIRGVTVGANILRTLEERGWIDKVGHKETPGRPALYGTTATFLDDLGLKALADLPTLPELNDESIA